jgi:hypothetical protein
MEQPGSTPATDPAVEERERAIAVLAASIDRLDELGLRDELGRAVVEPASTFHWS